MYGMRRVWTSAKKQKLKNKLSNEHSSQGYNKYLR